MFGITATLPTRSIVVPLAALLLAGRPAVAQVVRGALVDGGTDAAISGAIVALRDLRGREWGRVVTDAAGRFTLQAPTMGDYYLRAERDGLVRAFSLPITLEPNESVEYRLVAAPAAPGAELAGTVLDSTRAAPIRGATVFVAGTDRLAITDAAGRFRMTGVPIGRRVVWFTHPRLDSLGLGPVRREVELRAGRTETVELATPGPRTLYAASCGGAAGAPDRVALVGFVRDAQSGVRLPDAEVRLVWVAAGLPSAEVEVTTDAAGRYRVCDVPRGAVVQATVEFSGSTGNTAFRVGPGPVMAQDLRVLDRRPAHLAGQVLDHAAATPIAAAAVRLRGVQVGGITDEHGRFEFPNVPAGTYLFEVQHIAYGTTTDSIRIEPGALLDVMVRLTREVIELEPITVTARSQRLAGEGFYRRREKGLGRFMTRAEIAELHAMRTSDVLRRIPGIRVATTRVPSRYVALGRGDCRLEYVLDGVRVPRFDMDALQPEWIEGIEIHLGPTAPIRFGVTQCGFIVIWTRDPG